MAIQVTILRRTPTRVSYSYERNGKVIKTVATHKSLQNWVDNGGAVVIGEAK